MNSEGALQPKKGEGYQNIQVELSTYTVLYKSGLKNTEGGTRKSRHGMAARPCQG
jgi:hypothetical protein